MAPVPDGADHTIPGKVCRHKEGACLPAARPPRCGSAVVNNHCTPSWPQAASEPLRSQGQDPVSLDECCWLWGWRQLPMASWPLCERGQCHSQGKGGTSSCCGTGVYSYREKLEPCIISSFHVFTHHLLPYASNSLQHGPASVFTVPNTAHPWLLVVSAVV